MSGQSEINISDEYEAVNEGLKPLVQSKSLSGN